jgi:hypothetical protein
MLLVTENRTFAFQLRTSNRLVQFQRTIMLTLADLAYSHSAG